MVVASYEDTKIQTLKACGIFFPLSVKTAATWIHLSFCINNEWLNDCRIDMELSPWPANQLISFGNWSRKGQGHIKVTYLNEISSIASFLSWVKVYFKDNSGMHFGKK